MGTEMSLDRFRDGDAPQRVFGEPYDRADGTTVIPVARITGGNHPKAAPLGVFVVRDGEATWTPAVDRTRVALLGGLVGLVAAGLAAGAMLRRPPWPDVSVHVTKNV